MSELFGTAIEHVSLSGIHTVRTIEDILKGKDYAYLNDYPQMFIHNSIIMMGLRALRECFEDNGDANHLTNTIKHKNLKRILHLKPDCFEANVEAHIRRLKHK
ncbi:hypothetical protein ACTXT7_000406 [Hymenolepis weldensis]